MNIGRLVLDCKKCRHCQGVLVKAACWSWIWLCCLSFCGEVVSGIRWQQKSCWRNSDMGRRVFLNNPNEIKP